MIKTLEEVVIVGAMLIGLGGLWAFAIGGMAHAIWDATLRPLIERIRSTKG